MSFGRPSAVDRVLRTICFHSRANFATVSSVRMIVALPILLLSVSETLAQKQEAKLIDRLLKPNTFLKNPAQTKQFKVPADTSAGKRFPFRDFSYPQKSWNKELPAPRALAPREFAARHFRAGDSAAAVSSRTRLTKTDTIISAPAFPGARVAPESEMVSPVQEFRGTRPFLVQGKSQKALWSQNRPLTIEQVRELLNKSK